MALNNKLTPIAGRDQNGNYPPISVNEKGELISTTKAELTSSIDSPVYTQSSGRNVEEISIIKSLSLTDTSQFNSDVIDMSKYKKFMVFVENKHDVAVNLVMTPGIVNSFYWDNVTESWLSRASSKGTIHIPGSSGPDLYNITDFFTEFKDAAFKIIQVRGRAEEVPTKGHLECYAWGVPN